MPDVEMIKTWTAEEITTELREAIEITEAVNPPPDLRGLTFQSAVNLTTQRIPVPKHGAIATPGGGVH